jgi:hypothetical protein
VILDREEDEALRILLEERLICLVRLDGGSDCGSLHGLDHLCDGLLQVLGINLCLQGGEIGFVERLVLLVRSTKV